MLTIDTDAKSLEQAFANYLAQFDDDPPPKVVQHMRNVFFSGAIYMMSVIRNVQRGEDDIGAITLVEDELKAWRATMAGAN